ncbi:Tenascin-X like protein [Argiope bruennichi]|uniref:Tenascin-X like protein n=1 Tax=Argiope bruennichi TaxID=94029 RepID=A0A8T0EM61_ARGBR|nr:Tenascin-X like protein [Argiope bruennichi]
MIIHFASLLAILSLLSSPGMLANLHEEEPFAHTLNELKDFYEKSFDEETLPQDALWIHPWDCEVSSNGDKICFCEPMYKQRLNQCSYCDCGYHEGNCSFTSLGEKRCSCEPGFTTDSYEGICTEMCNATKPCQNGGTCYKDVCKCSNDYTGSWCETPRWCAIGSCGYEDDVECVWDRTLRKGECHCKEDNYYYLPKEKECRECNCGSHGSCRLADDVLVCKCDENYALKSSTCERCDCGSRSVKCAFDSRDNKVCQCQKGYASKTASWSSLKTWCEICDCGEHGRCYWDEDDKICDCDDGYRSYEGKCRECICGEHGTCQIDEDGDKICTCDYGYAEMDGFCTSCDCNYLSSRRMIQINCTFENGFKQCVCPAGFETKSDFCEDINECYTSYPCPANTICINKPGTFECKCEKGFEPIDPYLDPKVSGCKDIDECSEFPCRSQLTRCVNSPGSYDCVCREGYYSTSGNYGRSYKPAYNDCYEIETQWREATIALGVIFSFIIISITFYIKKHKGSS